MPNWPWFVWAILGAAFVLFIWPMLNSIVFGLVGSFSGGSQKASGV